MRKIRSNLPNSGFYVLVVGIVSLFVVLCMCLLLGVHRNPVFGVRVSPEESHYVMGAYDRSLSHFITITPGTTPRIFVEERELSGGLDAIDSELRQWAESCPDPQRVRVILVCDRAVPVGTVQRVSDMVLSYGFDCTLAGSPPTGK